MMYSMLITLPVYKQIYNTLGCTTSKDGADEKYYSLTIGMSCYSIWKPYA